MCRHIYRPILRRAAARRLYLCQIIIIKMFLQFGSWKLSMSYERRASVGEAGIPYHHENNHSNNRHHYLVRRQRRSNSCLDLDKLLKVRIRKQGWCSDALCWPAAMLWAIDSLVTSRKYLIRGITWSGVYYQLPNLFLPRWRLQFNKEFNNIPRMFPPL